MKGGLPVIRNLFSFSTLNVVYIGNWDRLDRPVIRNLHSFSTLKLFYLCVFHIGSWDRLGISGQSRQ